MTRPQHEMRDNWETGNGESQGGWDHKSPRHGPLRANDSGSNPDPLCMHPTHTVLAGLGERAGGVLYQRYLGSIDKNALQRRACIRRAVMGKPRGGRRDDSRDASSRGRQTGGDSAMNQQA